MEENEVNAEPGVVEAEAALATKESEVISQFQQKISKMVDQGFFQIGLRVFILEIEEFEDERILDGFLGRDVVARPGCCRFPQHLGFIAGKRHPLVELTVDLPIALARRPSATQCFIFVELASFRALDGEKAKVCCPRQRKADKCRFGGKD